MDPVKNVITYGIDVQEASSTTERDYIGAVYSADTGTLGTGVQIQNSPGASWQYAIRYLNNGNQLFSVDGLGNIAGSSLYVGGVSLNGDPANGSVDVGNLSKNSATPYIIFNALRLHMM